MSWFRLRRLPRPEVVQSIPSELFLPKPGTVFGATAVGHRKCAHQRNHRLLHEGRYTSITLSSVCPNPDDFAPD
eukprot:5703840-Pyramimonas_sp.AAC.1